jgi:hypothetical protein
VRPEERRAWKDDTCKRPWERENEDMEKRGKKEERKWWERSDR